MHQPAPLALLVLATYGLEIVEVGGAVARHVQAGGRAHATVTLVRPESREQVERAAAILGASVQFMDFTLGDVAPTLDAKVRFVRVIREVRPDVMWWILPRWSSSKSGPWQNSAHSTLLARG